MIFSIIYCRTVQFVFRWFAYLLLWRRPKRVVGHGMLSKLPSMLLEKKFDRILLITDKFLGQTANFKTLLKECDEAGIKTFVFDETVPNPTIENIEDAAKMYKVNKCKALVAFGGGSPIDCAKAAGIRIVRPYVPFGFLKGMLKVWVRIPYLVAIPTTAGTGSEVTVTTVVSDHKNKKKYPINDLVLIPRLAILDSNLAIDLPPHLTSTTGMDALTHAVESFINRSNTRKTEEHAIRATKLIFENLVVAYKNGQDIHAREHMLKASHFAGLAFTRGYVGYGHSVAHALGAFYELPHGLANAILLPYTVESYGAAATKRLALLAKKAEIVDANLSDEVAAKEFIAKIRELNVQLDIPTHIDCLVEKDLPALVDHALAEGNPFYPVPKIFGKKEMENLFKIAAGWN